MNFHLKGLFSEASNHLCTPSEGVFPYCSAPVFSYFSSNPYWHIERVLADENPWVFVILDEGRNVFVQKLAEETSREILVLLYVLMSDTADWSQLCPSMKPWCVQSR